MSGVDFTKIAQDSRAPLKVTDLFANGEILPEIGENQEFYKNAFALGAKDTSPIVEGRDAYYLLRLKQRKEPAVPPLDSVSAQIEKGLRESKAYEMALQRGNSLLDQLKKEKDIAKLAQANNLKLDETGWFLRSAPQLPKIGDLAEMKAGPIALSEQKPIPGKALHPEGRALRLGVQGKPGRRYGAVRQGKGNNQETSGGRESPARADQIHGRAEKQSQDQAEHRLPRRELITFSRHVDETTASADHALAPHSMNRFLLIQDHLRSSLWKLF